MTAPSVEVFVLASALSSIPTGSIRPDRVRGLKSDYVRGESLPPSLNCGIYCISGQDEHQLIRLLRVSLAFCTTTGLAERCCIELSVRASPMIPSHLTLSPTSSPRSRFSRSKPQQEDGEVLIDANFNYYMQIIDLSPEVSSRLVVKCHVMTTMHDTTSNSIWSYKKLHFICPFVLS